MSHSGSAESCSADRAISNVEQVLHQAVTRVSTTSNSILPTTSPSKLESCTYDPSQKDVRLAHVNQTYTTQQAQAPDTVLYLAYGSNLSAETFKGTRGIKPLSAVNVLVPSLALTFDLPGIPYSEPCFANTRQREVGKSQEYTDQDYHKDRWQKGLVGVVYEVTPEDYATIIATEGGGSSYTDILVPCYTIPSGSRIVNPHPTTKPFVAHTLFAPVNSPNAGRSHRSDPSYAQPSARYLKLIRDGADEHGLPEEYREYLADLRPFQITTTRQRIGQTLFAGFWMPVILALFAVGRLLADERGRTPGWFQKIQGGVFAVLWASYDNVFKGAFGDGERTIGDDVSGSELYNGGAEEKSLLRQQHDDEGGQHRRMEASMV